jgi:hypothetical protein
MALNLIFVGFGLWGLIRYIDLLKRPEPFDHIRTVF